MFASQSLQTTTRPITFYYVDHATRRTSDFQTVPAGTAVYARTRRGSIALRIPGTLLTADVNSI